MIRRNLLKATLLTTVIATLLVSTACGGKDQASTATEAQTTTVAVKQVNSTSTENATDKQEVTEASVENTEASNEEVLVAEAVIDENQGNGDSVEEVNNTVLEEQPAEDINATWTDTTPAEQPEENINSGWEDAAPVEQPIAPEPAPEPTPEPVVTPQEPAAPTLTDEERLVATGKWTEDINGRYTSSEGDKDTVYTYIDPITGYELRVLFTNGELISTMTKTREEYMAITAAHNNVMLSTIEGLEQL